MNVTVHKIIRSRIISNCIHRPKIRECFFTFFEPPSHLSKRGGEKTLLDRLAGLGPRVGLRSLRTNHRTAVRRKTVSSPNSFHGCRCDKDAAGIRRRPFDGEFYCHWQSFWQHSLSAYGASLWRVLRLRYS